MLIRDVRVRRMAKSPEVINLWVLLRIIHLITCYLLQWVVQYEFDNLKCAHACHPIVDVGGDGRLRLLRQKEWTDFIKANFDSIDFLVEVRYLLVLLEARWQACERQCAINASNSLLSRNYCIHIVSSLVLLWNEHFKNIRIRVN